MLQQVASADNRTSVVWVRRRELQKDGNQDGSIKKTFLMETAYGGQSYPDDSTYLHKVLHIHMVNQEKEKPVPVRINGIDSKNQPAAPQLT